MNADCLIWKWFFFTSLKRQRMCSTQLSSKLKQCPGKCQHKLTQVGKKKQKTADHTKYPLVYSISLPRLSVLYSTFYPETYVWTPRPRAISAICQLRLDWNVNGPINEKRFEHKPTREKCRRSRQKLELWIYINWP